MVTSEKIDLLKYHFFRSTKLPPEIKNLRGLDSEADPDGKPFLFCLDNGQSCNLSNIFETLFLPQNVNQHYACYNLKYDSGAILYDVPPGAIIYEEDGETIKRFHPGKKELWKTGETLYFRYSDGFCDYESLRECTIYKIKYIPHKFLKISLGKDVWVKFWDISQFFQMSLDKAARRYLNDKKSDMRTKNFTASYVKKNYSKIVEYCIQDASLTARLGNYLLQKVREFGVIPSALYSQASLSFSYFQAHTEIVGIKRYWKHHKKAVMAGIDAYSGGKFELTARGSFPHVYEYDIISAYPYEISRLANTDLAIVKHSKKYQKEAFYGFIRVRVKIYDSVAVPCGLLIQNTRVYAIGEYYTTITKAEYEYLVFELCQEVEIIDGYWLFIDNPVFPYKEVVDHLFALKSSFKGNDAMAYSLTKTMINGFYGKLCQVIENWKGEFDCGLGFHPFHAAVITANTRIKVSRIQNLYKEKCLGCHTDSIFLTCEIDPKFTNYGNPQLGDFEFVEAGPAILIACGCYQINEECAFKGLEAVKKKETWETLLKKYRNKTEIPYKKLRVESWVEATAKGHHDRINLFQTMPKDLSLNADIKRIWSGPKEMKALHYLARGYKSEPRIIVNTDIPEYWKI